ncbi:MULTISPECIES: ABC transporter ATP-binding protein [unclassified Halanaerobium]|uniref:ABC transporter ATP-binding protein n=1 Tax=unclassified Halanaerobium TaxID=2641197 RepID=UPI000E1247BF|nr:MULTISPECIES: ABC transporter ATP-binding protein [unclassified Halanaerobium]RCW48653.1 peptide/nickel transport system ATP-binding protein/oligopeptide transport system ATP-binding protein [Halanaerobium sp. MA284_MarDTE_T2]RCW86604.1 peptide/nickel transport system ATP-binding protein/oligopeptide transport system ATP-binding protein [Halanaerobium sp. DL-01]
MEKENNLDENEILLEVKNLKTSFFTYEGEVKALEDVSFVVNKGETLGLVGETGSGKSVTALSIMKLIPDPPGKILSGEINFNGENLIKKTEKEMQDIRGNQISMIFQDPMNSLNPVFDVGTQIKQVIKKHQRKSSRMAKKIALEMFKKVGLPDPEHIMGKYPHELSGGMQQRVMIATALSCHPQLLIADEPTTALDVTIQAQILKLIKNLRDEMSSSMLLITHDLGVVARVCDRVAVMYAGNIVEYAPVKKLFKNPSHPYTEGLLKAIPRRESRGEKLKIIKGKVPNLITPPSGCRFHPRCEYKMDVCSSTIPPRKYIDENHYVKCHLQF